MGVGFRRLMIVASISPLYLPIIPLYLPYISPISPRRLMIVASNEINEPTLLSLRQQGRQIDPNPNPSPGLVRVRVRLRVRVRARVQG